MCNDFEQHIAWAEYCELMQYLELGIPTHQSELDLPQADDIRIDQMGPVMRAAGNLIELAPMNFSFPPSGPKGGPIFNFRSEVGISRRAAAALFLPVLSSSFLERNIRKPNIASH